MSQSVRLMGIAGSGAEGSILISDDTAMLHLPQYFFVGYNGVTTQRPGPDGRSPGNANPPVSAQLMPVGTRYYDSTLSALCLWDGKNWRNPSTGALI
jgi:hypothetical protein